MEILRFKDADDDRMFVRDWDNETILITISYDAGLGYMFGLAKDDVITMRNYLNLWLKDRGYE